MRAPVEVLKVRPVGTAGETDQLVAAPPLLVTVSTFDALAVLFTSEILLGLYAIAGGAGPVGVPFTAALVAVP